MLQFVFVCGFRPAFDDLAHNSSLEAMGFMALFMPSTIMDEVEKGLNKSPRYVANLLYTNTNTFLQL